MLIFVMKLLTAAIPSSSYPTPIALSIRGIKKGNVVISVAQVDK